MELRRSDAHDFLGGVDRVSATVACWSWGDDSVSDEAAAADGGFVVSSGALTGVTTETEVVETGITSVVAKGGTETTSTSVKEGCTSAESIGVPTMETEVWEETGDPGTVGVSSDSVTVDDGTVESV